MCECKILAERKQEKHETDMSYHVTAVLKPEL